MRDRMLNIAAKLLGMGEEGSEERADKQILLMIAETLSQRWSLSKNRILKVLDNPSSDTKIWKKIQSEMVSTEVMFSLEEKTSVRVSVEIQWPENRSTTTSQIWRKSQVPTKLLKELENSDSPIIHEWVLTDQMS